MGLRGLEWCLMPMVIKSLSPAWDAVPNTAAAGFSAEPCTAPSLQARAHSEPPHSASRLPHLQTGCRSQQHPLPAPDQGNLPWLRCLPWREPGKAAEARAHTGQVMEGPVPTAGAQNP